MHTALQRIAEAIAGAERRAHVVLSARYTDWRFRQDLTLLNEELAIPGDQPLPPPPSPDELVISTIHHEAPKEKEPPEEPLVVVMTGLDEARVRQFAAGKRLKNLDAFMGQIEAANLWQFARRPLDLDWLVEFWHRNGRLGSLAEMLETCISERLRESNVDRARQDGLDLARAAQALERIGAALVFGRRETIAVPDGDIDFAPEASALDIADILPDWSSHDRIALLGRAVFDPATLGRARIHNDNQGVVRGYLTARWLHRLRQSNLSQSGLFDLLFAQTYGIEVVKPSMQETAAWLSLRDENVAREVARRNPFLLLSAGDPATLSQRARENLLREVITRIAAGERVPMLDFDSLKRFSRPDLADVVRKLWDTYAAHDEARVFLLRVIWLGEIKALADIAATVALGPLPDRMTSIVAGRALMATGDESLKKRYAAFVKANCTALPATVVWDALEKLFPRYLAAADFLDILSRVDVTATDGGLGLDWSGPKLLARVKVAPELEAVLTGLLSQLGSSLPGDRFLTKRQEIYISLITAATHRLLELSPVDQLPPPAIAGVARLFESARWSRSTHRTRTKAEVIEELQRSTQRRRLAFWGVAERLAGHRLLGGRLIDSVWDMQVLGWSVTLSVDDIDWLLADGPLRKFEHERRLAINTAMAIWRDAGSPDAFRERIAAVAKADPAMTAALDGWLKPRQPSPELANQEKEIKRLERRNALERAKHDQSWVDFAARLRANPAEMRDLRPTTAQGADSKLYHLWELLSQTAGAHSRYALDNVAPLEPMIGVEAAEGFRLGIIAHWRARTPWVRSAREDSELNLVRPLDCMGLVGISLEAKDRAGWAATLSSENACRAVEYATLELNGFPTWLADLAHAKPDETCKVLSREVSAELKRPDTAPFGVLQQIARSDKAITELMAPFILTQIETRPDLDVRLLSPALDIVLRGKKEERSRLNALALERFDCAIDPAQSTLYIGAAFAIDGSAATAAVFAKLDKIDPSDQPALVQRVLPHIFGRQFQDDEPAIQNLPLESLERLVRLAFRTVHPKNDNDHSTGEVYSPDARDDAEHARNAAFGRLVNTPNRAGFDAILRLAEDPDFPVPKARLHELAKERAEKDSESAAWKPGEAAAFEQSAQTEPQTPRDLQLVALRRLADLQHDLHHDDFQQGETLARLESENAVQRWTADRLRLKQGRSYSVEREVHVADENEPDIRLRAGTTGASVPIEIKVAESWTLEELEAALTNQLCEKYLRARDGRHGILLLVHQVPRPRGWLDHAHKALTFDEVVTHLRAMAVAISGSSTDAPQPEIAFLDVSSFTAAKAAKKTKKTAKPQMNARARSPGSTIPRPRGPR